MNNNLNRSEIELNEQLKRRKKNYNIKEEIPSAFKHNSNLVTYFKIINNQEEFNSFNLDHNLTNTFSPKFTNQVFNPNEEIIGYKNLKIFISLSPKLIFPYIKIFFDESLNLKDDINLLLEKHYETSFNIDQKTFMNNLNNESKCFSKGQLIYKNLEKAFNKELEIYIVDVKKDNFIEENMNLQSMITFFIDGASAIPIENNFWHYFLLFENDQKGHQKLIGFCSTFHFHMNLNKYRAMVSQFLILPQHQKKGFGQLLLHKIYDYYISDGKCIEVTVEDPAVEFILLRDITIFNKILSYGFFKDFLNLLPINHLEEYRQIKLNKEQVLNISNSLKIPKNLVYRCLEILKYIIMTKNTSCFYNAFRKEIKMRLYRNHRADMDPNYFLKSSKRKGPFIFFHDEKNYKIDVNDLINMAGNEMSRIEKLDIYYNDLEGDYKQIAPKCIKILKEFDSSF